MAGVIRSPVSGQVLVLNAGAHTGLYYSTGLLPEDTVVSWETLPSFVVIPSRVGDIVTVDPGVAIPEGAAVTAAIGTGTTEGTFVSHIDGTTGTVTDAMIGQEITARFFVQYTPPNPTSPGQTVPPVDYPSLTRIVRSGVVIAGVEPVGFPAAIATGQWTAEEVRDEAPAGRRRILVASAVTVPAGYEIILYSGPGDPETQPQQGATMTPGTAYTTVGVLALGTSCNNRLWWRRLSDGALGNPSDTKAITIQGLEGAEPEPGPIDPPTDFPAANETLTTATQAAIVSALNAERSRGLTTGTWIIDIRSGNYGSLSLAGMQMTRPVIIRSQGLNYGAVFGGVDLTRARNITIQFARINGVTSLMGTQDCGLEYNDVYAGSSTLNRDAGFPTRPGYIPKVNHLIRIDKYDNANLTLRARIYMNYIHGAYQNGIYINDTRDSLVAENVFADNQGDDIKCGVFDGVDFINNWGARVKYVGYGTPTSSNPNPVTHTDFIQFDARFSPGANNSLIHGNVFMKSAWPFEGSPGQGIFSSKSLTDSNGYENNIILTNSVHGISCESGAHGAVGANHTVRYCAAIKLADGSADSAQSTTTINVQGASTTRSNNIHSASWSPGADSIAIPTSSTNRGGGEAYYHSCRVGASFYDFRPIEGQPTHWAYSGTKIGPYQRFYDVIVLGKYPKIGAAGAAWKTWYDPRNQITS